MEVAGGVFDGPKLRNTRQGKTMLYLEPAVHSTSVHPASERSREAPGARDLDTFLSSGTVRILKPREHVFTAGDTRTHIYRIESGSVCLYKIMPDGRRQVIDFAYIGDFVGLGCQAEHAVNAQALETTRLKCIPVSAVTRMADRDPKLGLKLYEALSRELVAAQDHIFTVGQRSAGERVACFLLALMERNGKRCGEASTLVLPMTRSDIADFLGLTIETVSRTLTKLKVGKIIDLEHCTIVRILDGDRLERLAAGEWTL